MLRLIAAGLLIGATTAAAADAPAGDESAGRRLADAYCAQCHVVAPHGPAGWTDAPSFAAIANNPATTAASLIRSVEQPHMDMLHQPRNPADAANLAAYILSLKN